MLVLSPGICPQNMATNMVRYRLFRILKLPLIQGKDCDSRAGPEIWDACSAEHIACGHTTSILIRRELVLMMTGQIIIIH